MDGFSPSIRRELKDPTIRARVQVYQRECYDVLWRHFSGNRLQANSYESRSIRLVNEARLIYGPRAAAQLWRARGLEETPAMQELFAQGELFDEHHEAA